MTGHGDRAHAPYAPSSAERWMACTACVPFCEQLMQDGVIPESTNTIYTLGGTGMHERSEEHLAAGTDPSKDKRHVVMEGPAKIWADGKTEGLIKVDLTPEQWHPHVINYLSRVAALKEELEMFGDVGMSIEKRVRINLLNHDCWGSLDLALFIIQDVLYVIDLKTGSGHIVDPKDNPQFMLYAIGMQVEYKWNFKEVHLVAAQEPNKSNPFTIAEVSNEKLQSFLIDANIAIENSKLNPEFCMGSWCRFCPGKAKCPKQNERVLSVFEDDTKEGVVIKKLDGLSDEQIRFVVDNRDDIRSFIDACEGLAMDQAKKGSFPGYKLVEGRTRRKYKHDEATTIKILTEDAGLPLESVIEDPKLKSFTKIEKIIGKKDFAKLALTESPAGKPTLVPEDDKRKAIVTASVFDDVGGLLD